MKLIYFQRLPIKKEYRNGIRIIRKEVAFNEKDLYKKLNGDTAIVEMPAKPWYIQLWRKFFPLKYETKQLNS